MRRVITVADGNVAPEPTAAEVKAALVELNAWSSMAPEYARYAVEAILRAAARARSEAKE
jgi:hypothetical protein